MDIFRKLNGLSLFSGIGGLDLALKEWVRPVAYCEIDLYCQGVLLSRMADMSLYNGLIWDDVKTLRGELFKGHVDIVYGGFPCQDISIMWAGKGLEGERSRLFFEILRLAEEIKPSFIFLENVPAITSRGGLQIVREIAEMGYDCRWCVISAASMGAKHNRERWFLLAHSNCESEHRLPIGEKKRFQELKLSVKSCIPNAWPENESALLGVDDDVPFRMDRTKALGNAVVPAQARKAFQILSGLGKM